MNSLAIELVILCMFYSVPGEAERLAKEWKAAGKKLDMGKSCLRFKKLEDVPLEVIGKAVKRMTLKKFIAGYEEALAGTSADRKKTDAKKGAAKKTAARKVAKKASKKAPARAKRAPAKKAASRKAPARKKTTR